MKRATNKTLKVYSNPSDFNPRPREEGDVTVSADAVAGDISIHALVKRATTGGTKKLSWSQYFNPRPREEGDIAVNMVVTIFSIFQSTPS